MFCKQKYPSHDCDPQPLAVSNGTIPHYVDMLMHLSNCGIAAFYFGDA